MPTEEHTDPQSRRRADRERWEREWQEKQRRAAAARRDSPAGRRLSVKDRGLWAWFIPESRRMSVAFLGGLLSYAVLYFLPGFEDLGSRQRVGGRSLDEFAVLGTLAIAFGTLYTLITAALAHWVSSHLGRRELVAISRLGRARITHRWYRWLTYRTDVRSESAYLLAMCALSAVVLLTRPDSIPIVIPLVVTAAAIVAAWIMTVVSFASEYAAEDSHGTGLQMPGIPAAARSYEEYLDLAVLIQTTSGPPNVSGLTRSSRRAIRSQSVLAHVMSTVIISLTVSVILTSLT